MACDSDVLPLDAQPRLKPPVRWRRGVETCAVLLCLVGGGFGMGFVYGARESDAAHAAELGRLQEAWSGRLNAIAGRVGEAADTAASAAQVSGEAAVAAHEAATKADKAATTASKAATRPPAAAPVVPTAANAEIRRANQKLESTK